MSGTWSLLSRSSQFSGEGKVNNYYTGVKCSNEVSSRCQGGIPKAYRLSPGRLAAQRCVVFVLQVNGFREAKRPAPVALLGAGGAVV